MAEPLTDAEREALGWLRDQEHERFTGSQPWLRHVLVRRGLVGVRDGAPPTYRLSDRGRAALAGPGR